MSQFIGAAMPTGRIEANNMSQADIIRRRPQKVRCTVCRVPGYATPYWPSRVAGFLGDFGADVSMLSATWWGLPYPVGGSASRVGFVGTSRDQYGTPLPNCVMQLFRTSDDLFIMELVSDSNGNFLLQSPYTPDTHYIVGYKAGAPDVFGTTVNTLVGA